MTMGWVLLALLVSALVLQCALANDLSKFDDPHRRFKRMIRPPAGGGYPRPPPRPYPGRPSYGYGGRSSYGGGGRRPYGYGGRPPLGYGGRPPLGGGGRPL
ncbi:hypothetical protein Aduo_006989 [Ancylostoma duodenale]